MSYALTRPKFDTALDSVAAQLPLAEAQRELLWTAMRSAITGKLKPDASRWVFGWSPEATALRDQLRREIEACRKRAAEDVMLSRFGDLNVKIARPGRAAPIEVNVVQAFAGYRESLLQIQARMDAALRDGGHWRNASASGHPPVDTRQPIEVIVANERAAGRPAGTLDWTQWEIPKNRALFTAVFEQAYAAVPRGRFWAPYTLFESALSERGRAAHARRISVWRGAFHDELSETRYRWSFLSRSSENETERACGKLMHAFYRGLSVDNAQMEEAIIEACAQQARAHRTPSNPRFFPPNSVWHALDKDTRIRLAVEYNAVLVQCHELCLAANEMILAASVNPAVAPNPFALTPEELREVSAG